MKRFGVVLLLVFSGHCVASGQASPVDALEAKKPANQGDAKAAFNFSTQVQAVIEKNELSTADEFYRASKLVATPYFDFRSYRVRYELLLTAAAKGSTGAARDLATSWDFLMVSMGQPMRIDRDDFVAKTKDSDYFRLDRAPDAVLSVYANPANAQEIASKAKDNAEMQQIVDADQKARENFTRLTSEELQAMAKSDTARLLRTQEIVKSGDLHTANDFANAALVMQHSISFAGYRLAHELAVCSMLLGDKRTGRWLVAASYDRMLNSLGHDQRFGTQYGPEGFKITDERGICDTERLALGCPTLSAARARVLK